MINTEKYKLLLEEVKQLREVVDKQQMQYVSLETAYYNSPSQIEIKREIDTAVEYRSEHIKKYMKEKNKRLQQLIVDAAWQLHWNVGTIASSAHLSSKEWDEDIYAPAQAWRRQVQDILDASEEGCPWKESDE